MLLLLCFYLCGVESLENVFLVQTSAGEPVQGIIKELTPEGGLRLTNGTSIPASNWVSLRTLHRPVPPFPQTPHLALSNGDCLVGTAVKLEGAILYYHLHNVGNPSSSVRIPLSAIDSLWFRSPERVQPVQRKRLSRPDRLLDSILLLNNDVIAGTVTAIEPRSGIITVESAGRSRDLQLANVAAVAFSTRLKRDRTPKNHYLRAVLENGTRIILVNPEADQNRLHGTTIFQDRISLPLASVVALTSHHGSAIFLNEIEPPKYTYRSMNGEHFPFSFDHNLFGSPLRLNSSVGKTVFDKGLSIHAPATLTFNLGGRYQRFQCLLGMDPDHGRRGQVLVRILIDGTEFKYLQSQRLDSDPHMIKLNLSQAQKLEITVDAVGAGSINGCVNFCDAMLIK